MFTATALAQVFSVISIALVARSAGPSQFGVVSGALAVIAIISDMSDFGVNIFSLRAISTANWSVQDALGVHAQRLVRVIVPLSLGWIVLALAIRSQYVFIPALGLYVLSYSLNLGLSYISRGAGLFRLVTILTIAEKLVLLMVCLIADLVGSSIINWFAVGLGCAATFSSASYIFALSRLYPTDPGAQRAPSVQKLSSIYKDSMHLGLANLATDLNIAEVPLVAAFAGAHVAGEFAAATRLSGPLGVPFSALSSVLLPDTITAGPELRTSSLVRKCAPVVLTSGISLAVLATLAPTLTHLALGPSYGSSTSNALRFVCAITFMGGLSQIMYTVLQARFQERAMSQMLLLTVLLGLLFTTAGAYLGGATLAAAGGAVAQAIPLTLLTMKYRATFFGSNAELPRND